MSGEFSVWGLVAGTELGHYVVMTGACPEHGRTLSARLLADDRLVLAKPLATSGVGQASGLAVLATCESDVFEASCCLPGRVLVCSNSAISRRTVPIVVKGAHLATFSSLVFLGFDPGELIRLGDQGDQTVPVPMVSVERKSDHYWLSKATRVTVTVCHCGQEDLDLASDRVIDVRPERRRRGTQFGTVAATPGVVRR